MMIMMTTRKTEPTRLGANNSLRRRLMLGLSITTCVLWGSVAAWQFMSMQRELRNMLDERLIASAKMVAAIVQQIHPDPRALPSPAVQQNLHSLIARDGVACEVSLVRSEVDVLPIPIARTANSPDMSSSDNSHHASGFGETTKGGKLWRTYVLYDNGIRIATADRLDVREHLVHSILRTLVLPFALTLIGILLLTWWICDYSLRPLDRLRKELSERPPLDPTPVQSGQDVAELSPLVKSLNALLARINASMERERRWTANAAHELRTPLTAIKTHVQVAQLALGSDQIPSQPAIARDALDQADQGILHLQSTLSQLLQLARVENNAESDASCCDAAAIFTAFKQACEQSRHRAQSERPELAVQILARTLPDSSAVEWQPIRIAAAPTLLVCAITNLLDNALQHQQGNEQPVHATLELCADEEDGKETRGQRVVQIQIRNHGTGLSAEEIELATQRFWRKASTSNLNGSGLGLTIVQHIAESAGGSFALQSTAHQTTATLRFPVLIQPSLQR